METAHRPRHAQHTTRSQTCGGTGSIEIPDSCINGWTIPGPYTGIQTDILLDHYRSHEVPPYLVVGITQTRRVVCSFAVKQQPRCFHSPQRQHKARSFDPLRDLLIGIYHSRNSPLPGFQFERFRLGPDHQITGCQSTRDSDQIG